jgi:hypothetical protein
VDVYIRSGGRGIWGRFTVGRCMREEVRGGEKKYVEGKREVYEGEKYMEERRSI